MPSKPTRTYLGPFTAFAALLAACAGQPAETAAPLPAIETQPPAQQSPPAEQTPPEQPAGEQPASRPDWHYTQLTNVVTGETFTLADYEGQVLIVETMAVWCPLCTIQQLEIQSALGQLGEGFAVVSLDVDPGETQQILANYAGGRGFSWPFAIAGDELSATLQAEFGPQVLSPTSTPVLFIGPDGQTQLAPFGIKGAETLINMAQALAQ